MAITCGYCGESIPNNFAICWNCGASANGEHPPTRMPSDADEKTNGSSALQDDSVTPIRFRIPHLLAITTLVAIGAACYNNANAWFIFYAIVVSNLFGVAVGLLVTYVWGLPNDGSPPPSCQRDDSQSGDCI